MGADAKDVGYILVGFGGGWGTQIAVVLAERGKPDALGNTGHQLRIAKWRAQGKTWTRPAWVSASLVKGAATEADVRKYKVQPYEVRP